MSLRGPVLAYVDLEDATDIALRQGHALAEALKTTLVACHVLPEAYKIRMLFPQYAGIDQAEQRQIEAHASRAVVARVEQALGRRAASVPIEIAAGSPHAGILEAAAHSHARVIVLGPGPTAGRVARAAGCPILVARPAPQGGDVLGATDLSDPSLPAVRMAAAEAKRRGVPLRLVHCFDLAAAVVPATGGGLVPMMPLPPTVIQDLEDSARIRLEAARDAAGGHGEAIVSLDPPVAGILRAITPATALVVVGTHGRTGLARLALGSVAEAIMDRAPCPVLVVPIEG